MGFVSVLGYAQQLVKERVQPSDQVIDATIGNGNDTLFLAELVGLRGKVYGFDIQQAAIASTRERIANASRVVDQVQLILESHANMAAYIPKDKQGQIAAIMFNLGYLPGADESVITHKDSTLAALDAALALLRPRGIITVVLYPGHEGGDAEASAVQQWAGTLPPEKFQVLMYRFVNKHERAPYLLAIEKRN